MIDPRLVARQAEVAAEAASKQARRRRRRSAAVLALALVAGGAALAVLSPLASVRDIEVVGAQRTPVADVRAAAGLGDGPPLLRVDPDEVTARVEALAWVQRARLERRWPRAVRLTIEERQPAAVAPCLAGAAGCLVDRTGRVLAPAGDASLARGLPRLAGVPGAGAPGTAVADEARGALVVAVNLPSALRPLVSEVRSEGAEVSLGLRAAGREGTPPVVRLGSTDRIEEKLTAAATVLARTSVNGVAILDVRVPESPALTRVRR